MDGQLFFEEYLQSDDIESFVAHMKIKYGLSAFVIYATVNKIKAQPIKQITWSQFKEFYRKWKSDGRNKKALEKYMELRYGFSQNLVRDYITQYNHEERGTQK